MNIREGFGFDDVLLVPQRFKLDSRQDIDIGGEVALGIKIKIPLVSSNMLDVTESKMAIAMARLGAVGIIHRFMSIKQEVEEVMKVKRAENFIIENPYTIPRTSTVGQAKDMMNSLGIGGLLVNDGDELVGVITRRDLVLSEPSEFIEEVMTPKDELVTVREGADFEEFIRVWKKYKVEKIPVVDSGGKIKGLVVIKNLVSLKNHPEATKDKKGRLVVGASVGVKDYSERATALVDAGADFICIDVAHGHMDKVIKTIKDLKDTIKVPIIAGNVATSDGAKDLIDAGVDGIKVGIGPGSICTTRVVAGAGVPQITAIMDASSIARKEEIPVIADGGVKNSGDIVKALACGASSVMLGSLLSGTYESAGKLVMRNGKKYKMYSGMASVKSNITKREVEGKSTDELLNYSAEGMESLVEYKGRVKEILTNLEGGIRSGFSYCGASNIRELWNNAEFIRVRTIKEGLPKDLAFI